MTLRQSYQRPARELEDRIAAWLLAQGRWVTEAELLQQFGLKERDLRSDCGEPGLLSR